MKFPYYLSPQIWWEWLKGKHIRPKAIYRSIEDIDIDDLKERGIEGLIIDIDNTLTLHGGDFPSDQHRHAWERLKKHFAVVLFSNCGEERFRQLEKMFDDPLVPPRFKKPQPQGFAYAIDRLDLPKEKVAMVGDRLLTDILGANRFGIYSILVRPFDRREPLLIRIIRFLEGIRLW